MGKILVVFTDETEHKIRMAIAGQKQGAISELVEKAVLEHLGRKGSGGEVTSV